MNTYLALRRWSIASVTAALLLASVSLLRAQAPKEKEDDRPVVDDSKTKAEKAVANNLPTVFVVGDSTAKSNLPQRGWGDEFAPFFDTKKINVVNRAIGGRSSRTFIFEGRWDKVLAEMKTGDFVIVQFGHNDVGGLDESGKFRGSIKGLGDETKEIAKPDGKTEAKVEAFFADAGTHTTVEGAQFNARAVVAGLKGIKDTPFTPLLSDKAKEIAPFHDVVKK